MISVLGNKGCNSWQGKAKMSFCMTRCKLREETTYGREFVILENGNKIDSSKRALTPMIYSESERYNSNRICTYR
ncbi:hypothetical protein POPTR_001G078000v4 [Populus trichocarpa]|uniref:Uncharacterized protein n=1 Tax=Populus trichocarpa TaxID=3694 RepID=A0ACC0THM3_POPTR|nr:hypothetical protein POPTR_001G078000v4 [Populus trichocarpa]